MNSQGWPKDCTNEIEMLIKAHKLSVCMLFTYKSDTSNQYARLLAA